MCDTEVARVDGSIVVVDVLHGTCRYTEMCCRAHVVTQKCAARHMSLHRNVLHGTYRYTEMCCTAHVVTQKCAARHISLHRNVLHGTCRYTEMCCRAHIVTQKCAARHISLHRNVLHRTYRYTEMQPCFKACCSLALRRALPLQQFQKCPAQRSRSNQQQQSHTVCA